MISDLLVRSWRPKAQLGRHLVAWAVLLLCFSCRGLHAPAGSTEIRVVAPSEPLRAKVEAAAVLVVPALEAEFGVGRGRLTITVDLSNPGESRGASTSSSGITLYEKALSWVPGVLAHEAVHWLLHWRESYWNTLPIVIEEGLAQEAFHRFSETEPPRFSLDECNIATVLGISHEGYNALPDKRVATYCGAAIAQALGREQLRDLCRRAQAKGFPTIPADWVLEALRKGN